MKILNEKPAMFGKLSQLEYWKFNLCKKAAMFGLDARIALAIFGALSVISGVALYNTVKNAKATALLASMREIGKAWESYYLDTGKNIPTQTNDLGQLTGYSHKSNQLVENTDNIQGWEGPYLPYAPSGVVLKHNIYNDIFIQTTTNKATWGDNVLWFDPVNGRCPSGDTCSIWVAISGVKSTSIISILDKKIDNGDGAKSGGFRWYDNGGSPHYISVYLKIAPVPNPND